MSLIICDPNALKAQALLGEIVMAGIHHNAISHTGKLTRIIFDENYPFEVRLSTGQLEVFPMIQKIE